MVRVIAAALVLLLPLDAALASDVYTCKLQARRAHTWIGDDLVVVHDAAKGLVKIADAVTQAYAGGPIDGRVSVDNAKRITFAWTVRVTARDGAVAQMIYRATYLKSSGQLTASAQPAGYSNTFEKFGACTLIRQ